MSRSERNAGTLDRFGFRRSPRSLSPPKPSPGAIVVARNGSKVGVKMSRRENGMVLRRSPRIGELESSGSSNAVRNGRCGVWVSVGKGMVRRSPRSAPTLSLQNGKAGRGHESSPLKKMKLEVRKLAEPKFNQPSKKVKVSSNKSLVLANVYKGDLEKNLGSDSYSTGSTHAGSIVVLRRSPRFLELESSSSSNAVKNGGRGVWVAAGKRMLRRSPRSAPTLSVQNVKSGRAYECSPLKKMKPEVRRLAEPKCTQPSNKARVKSNRSLVSADVYNGDSEKNLGSDPYSTGSAHSGSIMALRRSPRFLELETSRSSDAGSNGSCGVWLTVGERMVRRSPRSVPTVNAQNAKAGVNHGILPSKKMKLEARKLLELNSKEPTKKVKLLGNKSLVVANLNNASVEKLESISYSITSTSRGSIMVANEGSKFRVEESRLKNGVLLRWSPRIVQLENSSSSKAVKNGSCGIPVATDEGMLRRCPTIAPTLRAQKGKDVRDYRSLPLKKMKTEGRKSAELKSAQHSEKVETLVPRKVDNNASEKKSNSYSDQCFFVGEPVPEEEARRRWPYRFKEGKREEHKRRISVHDDEDEIILDVKCHYLQASICGCILEIGDCAYVKGEKGNPNYVGRILEFFQNKLGNNYFRVQWFFRAGDTVLKDQSACHDPKRLFYSDLKNDNLLDCILSKVHVAQVSASTSAQMKSKIIDSCDFYYDMKYSIEYSTFSTIEIDDFDFRRELSSYNCLEADEHSDTSKAFLLKGYSNHSPRKTELVLLDLYSGCGGMSTGLCLGAQVGGLCLVTKWAVDYSEDACKSLRLNHPVTQVRNETCDDFLSLLKEWVKLCKRYVNSHISKDSFSRSNANKPKGATDGQSKVQDKEYEVLKLVDICYGTPTKDGKRGLHFKVRWKGYGPSEDTWEPIDNLRNCQERIHDFVIEWSKSKLLPLPGDVDVVCGGPPCQGVSGYNRFRNFDAPLEDERNRQIVVFMDIVKFLKPKYVLMENVADILKFAKGTLGRYALSRLVGMNYQARLGIMAAGCYGVPQYRLRVFLWGCLPCEKLPQFPLPAFEVILKGGPPTEFERNVVAYDEGQPRSLEKAMILEDVLSDLPPVTNEEVRDQMPYEKEPQTEFQKYIRKLKSEMMGLTETGSKDSQTVLYDHRPLALGEDDYLRVCKIPHRKGANFRDLPGVIVGPDNVVQFDPTMERIRLPSGRFLVPDYAMNYCDGKSLRPFSRLWWDDVVPTVLTVPDSHCQTILHPELDRVLTVRECARLQGFPDYYRFYGTVGQRYRQIGNAVAVPVSKALGYALAVSWLQQSTDKPLMILPPKFAFSQEVQIFPLSFFQN